MPHRRGRRPDGRVDHGRDTALGFYERHGWKVCGEGYEENGLPHHDVVLDRS